MTYYFFLCAQVLIGCKDCDSERDTLIMWNALVCWQWYVIVFLFLGSDWLQGLWLWAWHIHHAEHTWGGPLAYHCGHTGSAWQVHHLYRKVQCKQKGKEEVHAWWVPWTRYLLMIRFLHTWVSNAFIFVFIVLGYYFANILSVFFIVNSQYFESILASISIVISQ